MNVLLGILLQGIMGFGFVRHFGMTRGAQVLSLSFLVGLPLSALLVLAMDIVTIPLTTTNLLLVFVVVAVSANVGFGGRTKASLRSLRPRRFAVTLHELVFLFVIALFVAASVWQCIRLPVIPRDAIVGMDLVAKYAVAEGSINSSVFTGGELRGHLSNQPYYAPFTMLMQIVYRLAGMPFGKLWLSVMFLSFVVFLHSRLRGGLHPIPAGFLVLAFIIIPNMYSYTYLLLTDYANALFFGLGALFLYDYMGSRGQKRGRNRGLAQLSMSAVFMGCACFSRSETILFVVPGAALILLLGRKDGWRKALGRVGLFLLPSVILFLLWHWIYFSFIFESAPGGSAVALGTGGQDISATLRGMFRLLGDESLYGSMFYLFAAGLVVNLVVFRDRAGGSLLAWIAVLLVGFVLVVHVIPAASVEHTVKRGYFKLFPIMIFYLGESRLFRYLSEKLRKWETHAA